MVSYHVNPATGDPGVCRAKISCRFGSAEKHFDSKEDARKAYELEQEAFIPRKPEIEYGEIRFGKVTASDDIVKLSADLRNRWQKQPQQRFKIKDRYGYGTGVHYVSYDDQRDEFQFQRSMYSVPRLLESSRNLNELLAKVADQVGFADHEYEHIDIDEY